MPFSFYADISLKISSTLNIYLNKAFIDITYSVYIRT